MEVTKTDVYEIRREGVTVCRSSLPRCGYDTGKLRGMIADGYKYYVNGKMQRKADAQ